MKTTVGEGGSQQREVRGLQLQQGLQRHQANTAQPTAPDVHLPSLHLVSDDVA